MREVWRVNELTPVMVTLDTLAAEQEARLKAKATTITSPLGGAEAKAAVVQVVVDQAQVLAVWATVGPGDEATPA